MTVLAEIGGALRSLRENAGMHQGDVAARLNVSHQLVSCLERGARDPRLSVLFRILSLYGSRGVDVRWLDPRLIAIHGTLAAMPEDDRNRLMAHIEWAVENWMKEDCDAEALAPRPAPEAPSLVVYPGVGV